jgi:iron(III) transport system ATP-binding protein
MEQMIVCRNILKRFGKTIAVNDVNLNIKRNEIFAIMGPSGSGKTTLLRCIAGLEKPDKGQIIIENEVVFDSDKGLSLPPHMRGVGMVFQTFAVWPHMTVFENIAYPLKLRKMPREEINKRVKDVIELVGLRGLETRYPHQLSGGQQQRVSLARALVMQPKVILFDEPMSNLDAKLAEKLKFDIKFLIKTLGITAIYVTHNQLEALSIADRIAIMSEGKILEIGSPIEIFTRPKHPFTAEFVGVSNILSGKVINIINRNYVEIDTEIGKLVCVRPYELMLGDRVVVCLRANKIKMLPYQNLDLIKQNYNLFEGRIKLKSFVGEYFIYIIDVNGVELRVHMPNEVNLSEDTKKIVVTFEPSDVIILKGE